MGKMKNYFILPFLVFVLSACKADKTEVSLRHSDIVDVFQTGTQKSVEFEASFSGIGEISDYQNELEELRDITSRFLDIDIFEIEESDFGFEVTIEGLVPLTTNPNHQSPYIILIKESDLFPNHLNVSLANGASFDSFSRAAERVNFLLSPDQFHPVRFKVSADDKAIVAGGVRTEGRSHGIFRGIVSGRQSFSFSGGAYDEAGGEFHIEI